MPKETKSNTISAPGKLMVMGEYAVLEGAPALVMAVNRRVSLRFLVAGSGVARNRSSRRSDHSQKTPTISPEIALALTLGRNCDPAQNWTLKLDMTALLDQQGNKLGLGSSAAKAAASAAFVVQSTQAEDVLPIALEAHRAVAPKGSGADVAACTYGGLVTVQRSKGETLPDVQRVAFPKRLHWRSYFSGQSASTVELVHRVSDFRDEDPKAYSTAIDSLRQASESFHRACVEESPETCLGAARQHHRTLRVLGLQAGVSIVDDALELFASDLPKSAAVKPSGAGGGDVSIVFFDDRSEEDELDRLATRRGFQPLAMSVDEEGPRFD